ncbi:MAG: LytTR family DNA-binding domain-containing protein [Rikenellaceae bacterium]
MKSLKTIVIDDEPLALGLIESYVNKTPSLELIASFSSAVEALHSSALKEADLLFLDIQMPTLNGLEFSRMINPETRIIFTTAFDQYAIDGWRVNALDYLLKPISYSDFFGAVAKGTTWFNRTESSQNETPHTSQNTNDEIDSIYVKSDYKVLRIDLTKLTHIEGLKDYVKFYVNDAERPILSLMSIKRVLEILPERDFIRVNRSFIIRKDQICIIERSRIVIGKQEIPISDAYRDQLNDYLRSRGL